MSDTTIEVTEGSGEEKAEESVIESVAETAKSEGKAELSAEQAVAAADDVKFQTSMAENAAQASTTAMVESEMNASRTEAAAERTAWTVESLGEKLESLNATLSTLVERSAPQDTAPVVDNPATIEVETEPKRGHWLTRKWGAR